METAENFTSACDFDHDLDHALEGQFNVKLTLSMEIPVNWYLGVFGVADYDFEVDFQKFKMVDPIWLTKFEKTIEFFCKLVSGGFRDR